MPADAVLGDHLRAQCSRRCARSKLGRVGPRTQAQGLPIGLEGPIETIGACLEGSDGSEPQGPTPPGAQPSPSSPEAVCERASATILGTPRSGRVVRTLEVSAACAASWRRR